MFRNSYRKVGLARNAVMPVADKKNTVSSILAGNPRPYIVPPGDKAVNWAAIKPIVASPSTTTPSGITGVVINGPPNNPTKTKQYCPTCGQRIRGT